MMVLALIIRLFKKAVFEGQDDFVNLPPLIINI